MRCIPRDLKVIQNRQNTIEYLCHPVQFETTKQIKDALPKIRSMSKYLKKLTGNQMFVQDWKALKGTLVNMLLLGQVCSHNAALNPNAPEIIRKIGESVLGESVLAGLVMNFERVFDVELSENNQRFSVKSGFDEILDEKRRVHNGLPNLLVKIALEEIHELPEFFDECIMTFVPQIGYMISVEPWPGMPGPNCEDEFLELFPDLKASVKITQIYSHTVWKLRNFTAVIFSQKFR